VAQASIAGAGQGLFGADHVGVMPQPTCCGHSAWPSPHTTSDEATSLLGASSSPWRRTDYLDLVCTGGFPEIVSLPARGAVTDAWFDGYLKTVIMRDVANFAHIQHGAILPRLLALLAARAGSTFVVADLARTVELSPVTTRAYMSYLDTVFLTATVPPWSTNLTTKAAKTPKVYLTDSGLAAHLLGIDAEALQPPGHRATGGLVETFVFAELTRLLAQQDRAPTLRFFRDRDGREVDFILETRDGRIAGIEIKSSTTVTADDFRHLRWLRERLGDRFAAGVVLHLGPHTHSFADRMVAAPLSAIWHHAKP